MIEMASRAILDWPWLALFPKLRWWLDCDGDCGAVLLVGAFAGLDLRRIRAQSVWIGGKGDLCAIARSAWRATFGVG